MSVLWSDGIEFLRELSIALMSIHINSLRLLPSILLFSYRGGCLMLLRSRSIHTNSNTVISR